MDSWLGANRPPNAEALSRERASAFLGPLADSPAPAR
ncbi:MAG: hypothetical protein BWY56_02308 [Acidobacteria bacterium ADurb.Bin340]|nr:MAG: hypothetical protein BWY56_02308 [Acidobacteria bacterium ADurb.Bin340]